MAELTPESWMNLAIILQMQLHKPEGAYSESSFRALLRIAGAPLEWHPGLARNFQYWLRGNVAGVDTWLINYTTGSSSSEQTWTAAIAQITPNLLMQLQVARRQWHHSFLGNVGDLQLGMPQLDNALVIGTRSVGRSSMLFDTKDTAGMQLAQAIAAQCEANETTHVSDSAVHIALSGVVVEPARLREILAQAAQLANSFRTRVLALPLTQAEHAARATWTNFAQTYRLAHDVAERRVYGAIEQVRLSIETDSTTRGMFTVVQFAFAQQLGESFACVRTDTSSFFQGLFSQDIQIGERNFDARYQVQGDHVEGIQRLLRKPDLLAMLTDLGNRARAVEFTQQGVYAEVDGEVTDAAMLEYFATMTHALSRVFFGQTVHAGAYR